MAIVSTLVRAAYVAFAAAILAAAIAAISNETDVHAFADPCTQVTTNGSAALRCGTQNIGGVPYTGGCTNAYGTYQNCIVELLPPSLRPSRQ
ncbi:MAG TPA: hypothetical protein VH496_03410 [Mycobacterium sp.]|jgi:hypothetical protein